MPVYEFDCPEHGTFERLVRFDEAVECDCGSSALRRSVYAPTVVIGGQLRDDDEVRSQLRKRGWDTDRAFHEIRKNTATDENGQSYLNIAAMTKEA